MPAAHIPTVGCLIREVLYAPECPMDVAKLFEVALVHHNNGELESSINTFLLAQSTWEAYILARDYTDLDDPEESSMLKTLVRRERLLKEDAELQHDAELVAKARRDVELTAILEKEAERAAAAAAQAAALAADTDDVVILPFQKQRPGEQQATLVDGAPSESLLTKADLKRFEEAQERRIEKRQAEQQATLAKARERQERKMQAMYECPHKIPAEAHIFIQLSIGSVLQSAGADERALRCYLFALEICEKQLCNGAPMRHPVTACAHSCVASVFYHIAQYDFAADHYFKALEIREQLLPQGHVDIAATLNNIACVLMALDRTNDALVFLYRASDILAAQLDDLHPRCDTVKRNIKKAKQTALEGVVPPAVPPKLGIVPPRIPGAVRAADFTKPKPKKPKAKEGKKK